MPKTPAKTTAPLLGAGLVLFIVAVVSVLIWFFAIN
jgi:hypothetical protein